MYEVHSRWVFLCEGGGGKFSALIGCWEGVKAILAVMSSSGLGETGIFTNATQGGRKTNNFQNRLLIRVCFFQPIRNYMCIFGR